MNSGLGSTKPQLNLKSQLNLKCKLISCTFQANFKCQLSFNWHLNLIEVGLFVFNATFNNISAISWQSVLLVEETEGPEENHRPVASYWQILPHNVVHLALIEIQTHNISGVRHWLHM